jgi:Domain of unknown function (DUF5667)
MRSTTRGMSYMSEHRVPMLGSTWRRYEDPVRSRDPRVRALVDALAALPAPAPRPQFRGELRAQLVAIAPRIVLEEPEPAGSMIDIVPRTARPRPTPRGARAVPVTPTPAKHSDNVLDRLRRLPLARPLAIAASVVTVFAVLLGGAVWMSQKSVPGDALYGLKRASESFELATAGSDTERAQDHLKFAKTRAEEVQKLIGRSSTSAAGARLSAGGGVDEATAELINSTLAAADSDVTSASSLLGKQAVKQASQTPLDALTTWAPGQLKRLDAIADSVPDPSLRTRTETSAHLVRAAVIRANELKPRVGCGCLDSSGNDSLGPKPCTTCSASATPGATHPRHTGTSTGKAPAARTSDAPAGSTPGAGGKQGGGSSSASVGGSSTTPKAGLTLPNLPLPTSKTPPVAVDSCKASVNLPILGGINISLCKSSPGISH